MLHVQPNAEGRESTGERFDSWRHVTRTILYTYAGFLTIMTQLDTIKLDRTTPAQSDSQELSSAQNKPRRGCHRPRRDPQGVSCEYVQFTVARGFARPQTRGSIPALDQGDRALDRLLRKRAPGLASRDAARGNQRAVVRWPSDNRRPTMRCQGVC